MPQVASIVLSTWSKPAKLPEVPVSRAALLRLALRAPAICGPEAGLRARSSQVPTGRIPRDLDCGAGPLISNDQRVATLWGAKQAPVLPVDFLVHLEDAAGPPT